MSGRGFDSPLLHGRRGCYPWPVIDHHEQDPATRHALDAVIARFRRPDEPEDEHDRRTLGDRAAALVAWAEREQQGYAADVEAGAPPEGEHYAAAVSVTVSPELFDVLALAGRAGWTLIARQFWTYGAGPASVQIKRGAS